MSSEAVREMTFEEEYEILKRESEKVFATEDPRSEPIIESALLRQALRCIRKLQEQQPKTDWIPCEERLPSEENEEYLVCKKNGCLMLLVWTKKGWNTYKDYYGKYYTECEINDVIAWMPKPQPYKKEGAE